jgi:hypothetical protein
MLLGRRWLRREPSLVGVTIHPATRRTLCDSPDFLLLARFLQQSFLFAEFDSRMTPAANTFV